MPAGMKVMLLMDLGWCFCVCRHVFHTIAAGSDLVHSLLPAQPTVHGLCTWLQKVLHGVACQAWGQGASSPTHWHNPMLSLQYQGVNELMIRLLTCGYAMRSQHGLLRRNDLACIMHHARSHMGNWVASSHTTYHYTVRPVIICSSFFQRGSWLHSCLEVYGFVLSCIQRLCHLNHVLINSRRFALLSHEVQWGVKTSNSSKSLLGQRQQS